jgi:hypothetical protein
MKHHKLILKSETVRTLGLKELTDVGGGSDTPVTCDSCNCTQFCTNRPTACRDFCPWTDDSCLCVPP